MNPQLIAEAFRTGAQVLALISRNVDLYLEEDLTDEEFRARLRSVQDRFADLRGAFEVDQEPDA